MQITVKEAKKVGEGTKKDGKPWKLYAVVNEDGIEYTTFDTKAGHITPGAVIEIGDITLKDGDKRSFKELVVISEGPASGPKPNGDMSKEDWEKKQSLYAFAGAETQTLWQESKTICAPHFQGAVLGEETVDQALDACQEGMQKTLTDLLTGA